MTGMSETQAPSQHDPVILPAEQPSAAVDTETFCQDKQPDCGTRFHDVIYVTGQRRFWLLPKRVAEQLKESASQLKQQTVDTEQATRMSKIADAGLLDYFLTPVPEAFLESTESKTGERERYLEARAAIEDDAAKETQLRKDWFAAKAVDDSTAAMNAEREMFRAQQRIKTHKKNMSDLEKISESRAIALGYKREDGVFYTPRALQARDAMDRYLAERDKAKKHGFRMFDPGTKTIASAWDHLRHYKALKKQLAETGTLNESKLKAMQISILLLEAELKNYIDAIRELAECGIAVPEFALSPDDQYEGTEAFLAYIALLNKRANLEKAIEARYSQWVSATAGNAAPPGALFGAMQSEWHALNDEAEQLKSRAEATVRQALPPRLFVWEPESYKPKPLERLAKANIPLRELSSASSGSMLNHISLKNLARATGGALAEALNDLKSLPKPLARTADEDRVFSSWLESGGAHPLSEGGPWFDSHGLFLPDTFFAELKKSGFTIDSLQAPATRQRWGATLKAMIFEDKQLRNLMLFDNSPQAQLVRCLLPEGTSLQTSAKVLAPKWHKGLQLFGTEVALDVAAWRGEVSFVDLEVPKRSEAKSLKVDYTAHDGSVRTLDLGMFSLDLSVKAWGFAGASLMLARNLTLDQTTGYTSIAGVDTANRSGELAQFDLFVGAQAGCKVAGKLSWCPPPSVLPLSPIGSFTPPGVRSPDWKSKWRSDWERESRAA